MTRNFLTKSSIIVMLTGAVALAATEKRATDNNIQIAREAPSSPDEDIVAETVLEGASADGVRISKEDILWGRGNISDKAESAIFVAIVNPAYRAGGASGYEHQAYLIEDEEARQILSVNANEISIDCAQKHNGFCDLLVDQKGRLKYSGERYVSSGEQG